MTDCVDLKECFVQRQNLPACKGSCSIRAAMADPRQWEWIRHLADNGNEASALMVARAKGHFAERDLPRRTRLERSGKHFYHVPV